MCIINNCGIRDASFDLTEDFKEYGDPIQVSPNGQVLVMVKHLPLERTEGGHMINNMAIFTICRMTPNGLLKVKEISLKERLSQYSDQLQKLKGLYEFEGKKLPKVTAEYLNRKLSFLEKKQRLQEFLAADIMKRMTSDRDFYKYLDGHCAQIEKLYNYYINS